MLTPFGVAVTAENARHLVASLFADGSPAAMSAAAMIAKDVDRDLFAVGLTPAMRDAMLSVLEDPPDGLTESRGVLARDRRDRSTERIRAEPKPGRSVQLSSWRRFHSSSAPSP
jgi:hypothetical protein